MAVNFIMIQCPRQVDHKASQHKDQSGIVASYTLDPQQHQKTHVNSIFVCNTEQYTRKFSVHPPSLSLSLLLFPGLWVDVSYYGS